MDHHDPFHGSTNDPFSWKKEPIPVEDFSVHEPQTGPSPSRPQKQRTSAKLAALCLVCALVGGAAGGSMVYFTGGSGASSTIYSGDRAPVTLETVSIDTRQQLSVPEVYANYVDSCVGISVGITTNFFGQTVTTAAAGSGFVITEDGYIITNYHVIDGANTIDVIFEDGSSYPATVVGGEADNDIAVIKIEATGLKPVIIGDSDDMYVGESVVTVGNPLGELTFSLSNGVVSAMDRVITMSDGSKMNMLQTNCTINSGNSGGPLFNLYGEVIGIVSAKYSSSSGDILSGTATVEGLGFAIPINDVSEMITDIIQNGYVTGKPFLGISVKNVEDSDLAGGTPAGAVVFFAAPGLCAARDGIFEGDVVTAVGDVVVATKEELIAAKNTYKSGDVVNFTVYRNGETLVVPVTMDEENMKNSAILEDYVTQREAAQPQVEESQPQTQLPQRGQQQEPYSDNGNGGNSSDGVFSWPF